MVTPVASEAAAVPEEVEELRRAKRRVLEAAQREIDTVCAAAQREIESICERYGVQPAAPRFTVQVAPAGIGVRLR